MTPKQKAFELCKKMDAEIYPTEKDSKHFASDSIECALICVDEVRISLRDQYNRHYSEDTQLEIGYWNNSDECKFWTEVKDELEKLK